MDKVMEVKIRNVYGNDAIYPNCDVSNLFAALVRKQTFNQQDIDNIKKLGYTINVAPSKVFVNQL